jgi:PAS domain S-box-containing protein/diguanylate cyclase (GGDEF)-like protein
MPNQAEANLMALLDSSDDLIWSVDLDFRLTAFNRAFENYCRIHFHVQPAAGIRAEDFLPRERAALWTRHYLRVIAEGPYRTECPFTDGRIFEVAFNPIAVAGQATGISVFSKDITELKRSAKALKESEARFRRFFESNGSVMLFVDPASGEIFDANRAAVQYYGYPREQLIGMSISKIHALPSPEIFCQCQQALRKDRVHFNFRHRLASGEERDVEVYSSPVQAAGRALLFSIVHDVTERERAEQARRESEESLRESQKAAGLGSYALDIRTGRWSSSEILDAVLGIGSDYPHDVNGWTALVHPDDRAMMAHYFADEVVGKGKPFGTEYRIVRPADGAVRWVDGVGSLEFDAQQKPLKMSGLIHDITERKLAEIQLRQSEERYRATFDQAAVGFVHTSCDGRFLRCNRCFADYIGYSSEEIVGLTILQITHPEDMTASMEVFERIVSGAAPTASFEKRYLRKDGSSTWAKVTISMQRDAEGRALHMLSIVEDINARKQAEELLGVAMEALRVSEERYRTAFQTSLDAVNINRLSDGRYIDCNQAFLDVSGYTREEVVGRTSLELNIWADPRDRQTMVNMVLQNSICRNFETQFRKKSGEIFWGQMSASVMEIDGADCILSITRNLSPAKDAENTIRNLAFYDPLTGLPNRRLLFDRLHRSLSDNPSPPMSGGNRSQALLLIDLDHFRLLNETFGYQAGGQLLQEVARRIAACVTENDTVARAGGNEYGVLLDGLSEVAEEAVAQAESAAERILTAVGLPYLLGKRECLLSASIGVTVFGNRRSSPDEILQQAVIALHQAKAAGGNTTRFFSPALQAAVNARAALDEDLRQAIKKEQFLLYYQPQVERGRLTGAEALLRWNHPRRGILPPGEFIPLAEETGLILPLGDWVLEAACAQIASWAGRGETADLEVAVNISALQFRQPDFVERVLAVLNRTGANPRKLNLELTESMLVENIEEVLTKMTELKSHGLRFSLDDFGTGYSSLAYLKRLPLDQLKIDLVFVRDMLVEASSGAIAQTILSLGRAMGLSVVAEGVETEEQRRFLADLGCHCFQGYLFSHPLPLGEFEAFWRANIESPVPLRG